MAAKRKAPNPSDDFGIPAALKGDPNGLVCFLMFVQGRTADLAYCSSLPPLMKARLMSISKEADRLKEYADGYAAASKRGSTKS